MYTNYQNEQQFKKQLFGMIWQNRIKLHFTTDCVDQEFWISYNDEILALVLVFNLLAFSLFLLQIYYESKIIECHVFGAESGPVLSTPNHIPFFKTKLNKTKQKNQQQLKKQWNPSKAVRFYLFQLNRNLIEILTF